jgi:hypothetical protein
MTDDHPEAPRVEIDHTLEDITFLDAAGQPLGPVQVASLVDRTTWQIISWWLEPIAAPTSKEPRTML